jgi:hypothetical protein
MPTGSKIALLFIHTLQNLIDEWVLQVSPAGSYSDSQSWFLLEPNFNIYVARQTISPSAIWDLFACLRLEFETSS